MSEFEPSNIIREASPEIIENLMTFAEKGKRLREWVGMELSTDHNPLKYGHYAIKVAGDLSLTFAQSAYSIAGHFEEDWKAQQLITEMWFQDDQKRVNYFTHLMGGDLFKALGKDSVTEMVGYAFEQNGDNVQQCVEKLHGSYSDMLTVDMSAILNAAFRADERRVQNMARELPLATAESSHRAMSWAYFSELSKNYGVTALQGVLRYKGESNE